MTLRHRVIWSQGMFLQPHHFQQEARFFEHLVDARLRAAEPYAWGFGELLLDEAQLALGSLALTRASGVMTDGTPFSMPDADALPAAYAVPNDVQGEVVETERANGADKIEMRKELTADRSMWIAVRASGEREIPPQGQVQQLGAIAHTRTVPPLLSGTNPSNKKATVITHANDRFDGSLCA